MPTLLKDPLFRAGLGVMAIALAALAVDFSEIGPFEFGSPASEVAEYLSLGVPIGLILCLTAWSLKRKKSR